MNIKVADIYAQYQLVLSLAKNIEDTEPIADFIKRRRLAGGRNKVTDVFEAERLHGPVAD